MSPEAELYRIYSNELLELEERYQQEKDYLYNAMKEFTMIYEKESYLKQKLEVLERQIAENYNKETANDG